MSLQVLVKFNKEKVVVNTSNSIMSWYELISHHQAALSTGVRQGVLSSCY